MQFGSHAYGAIEYGGVAGIDVVAYVQNLTDTVILADSLLKTLILNKGDNLTLIDALIKTLSLNKTDTLLIIDDLSKRFTLNTSDIITITDLFSKITDSEGRIYIPYEDRFKKKRGAFSNKTDIFHKKPN